MHPTAARDMYAGDSYEAEDNAPAKTAGQESHEDPWKYADLDAPHSPPTDTATR